MKCTVSFVSVVVVVLIVGTLASIILFTIRGSCPSTSFKCEEDDKCLDLRYSCDGKQNCVNGSDEDPYRCADFVNLHYWLRETLGNLNRTKNTTTPRPEFTEFSCYVRHPMNCSCRRGNRVFCQDLFWESINWTLFDNETVRLLLTHALVGDWKDVNSVNFSNLKVLLIEDHPEMRTFPITFLKDKKNVNSLYLENNGFVSLEAGSFSKMAKVETVLLTKNSIKELHPNAFIGLDSLITLDLSFNEIQFDWMYQFTGMPQLGRLLLQNNQIENIGSPTFRQLTKLSSLNLNYNRIQMIHPRAFRYNEMLREIHISGNNIHLLDPNTFYGLSNLIKLNIAGNPIHRLSPVLFSSSTSLQSLDLQGLDLENIDPEIFSLLRNLSFVHFKKFEYCQYVPRVPNCRPKTDGISSIQNLLNGNTIRIVVWVIAFLTITGNVLVITTRWRNSKETRILDVFIMNLAVADLLMGFYLVVIGIKDNQYRGFFNMHAYTWYNSWECILIGILAMVSSEVSLLILTVMSLERYLVISGPFSSSKKLTRNWAMASMGLLWAFIITLAVTPAFMWNSSYFGSTGLCFTLHLHDPFAIGWEYNAFVFIGINSLCLICIAIFYGRLFWVVRATSSSTPVVVKDIELAIRFFLMVLTDFSCWAPIIFLKFAALKGYRVPDSLLAWMTIFVMPLNSAINPMLYTFSTGKIRIRMFSKLFETKSDTRNQLQNLKSIEDRLMTPEATDDSKINSSQDWRHKLSVASSEQSDSFSIVASRSGRSKRQDSAASNVSDGGVSGIIPY